VTARLVDLTMILEDGVNTYPGSPKMAIMNRITHEWSAGRYSPPAYSATDRFWLLNEHVGTHVDAPYHFVKDGAAIDALPLSRFWGEALLADVSKRDAAKPVSRAEIETALALHHEEVKPDDILVLRCWGGRPSDPGFTSAAALALEVGSWLVEVGVKAIGIDLPAVDNPGSRSFPVHMALLSAGIPIYENLVNLEEIDEPRFTFFGFPLRVAGASGSAVRAVAIMGASAGTLPSNSGW
jgi:kynurenine formamidase